MLFISNQLSHLLTYFSDSPVDYAVSVLHTIFRIHFQSAVVAGGAYTGVRLRFDLAH